MFKFRLILTLFLSWLLLLPGAPAQAFLPLETTLFDNQNIHAVSSDPTQPMVFSTENPHQITFIETYHWNNMQGRSPGHISLRHSDGTQYGPWAASSRAGYLGVLNAYWSVAPYEVIRAGAYTVINSDPASWSHNSASGNQGFATVKGIRWYGDVSDPDNRGLESIQARVVAFQFYEQPFDDVPFGERAYSRTFEKQSTRYVAYELSLEYDTPGEVLEIPLTVRYYRPDGSEMGTLDHTVKIQPDRTRSWYWWSWGWRDPGNWPAGNYTVKVFEAEREIVSGTFSIVESAQKRSGFPVTIDESTVDYFLPVPEFSDRPFSLKRSYDPFGAGLDWFESSIIQPEHGGLRITGLQIDDTDYWLDMQIDLFDPALPLKIIDFQLGEPKTPYPAWPYGNDFVDFRMSRADIFGPPPYFSIFNVGMGGLAYNLDFMFNNNEFVLTGIVDSGYIHYFPDKSAPELGIITSTPEPPVLTDQHGLCFADVYLGAPVAFFNVDLPEGEDYAAVNFCSQEVIQKFNVHNDTALGFYVPNSMNQSRSIIQSSASTQSGWGPWLQGFLPPRTLTLDEQLGQCIQDQTTLTIGLGRDNELSDALYNLAKNVVFSDQFQFSNKTLEAVRTTLDDGHDLIVNALSSGRMDEGDLTVFILKTALKNATPEEQEAFVNHIFDGKVPEKAKELSIAFGTASTEEKMYKQALLGLVKGLVKIKFPISSAAVEAVIEAQKWAIEVMADEDIRIMYQEFKKRDGNWADFSHDSIRNRPNASMKIKENLKRQGKQNDDVAAWRYKKALFESWYQQERNFPSKHAELNEIKKRYLDVMSFDVREGVERRLPFSNECERLKLVLHYFNRAMLDLFTSAKDCDTIPDKESVRYTAWRMVQDQFGNRDRNVANKNYQKTKLDFLNKFGCLHVEEREEEGIVVPNVVGMRQSAAENAIEQAGLVAVVTTAHHDTIPAGQVISQEPAPGTRVDTGSPVRIVISSGPDPGQGSPVDDLDPCRPFGLDTVVRCGMHMGGARMVPVKDCINLWGEDLGWCCSGGYCDDPCAPTYPPGFEVCSGS